MKLPVWELKQLLARRVGAAVDLDGLLRRRRDRYVLAYHRVIPAPQAAAQGVHSSLWISPQRFEEQLLWMKQVGEIVDFARLFAAGESHDRPLFAVTFDDGWKDNYRQALPLLQRHRVPAVVFLATQAVDSGQLFWPEDIACKTRRLLDRQGSAGVPEALAECWPEAPPSAFPGEWAAMLRVECWIEYLKTLPVADRGDRIARYCRRLHLPLEPQPGFILDWKEVEEMLSHGIGVGSHTHNHTIVKHLPAQELEAELSQSRDMIRRRLGVAVDSFCYPNARYSGSEGESLARCGYRYGFRIDNRSLRSCRDHFYVPRFLCNETLACHPDYFKLRLLGVPLCRPRPHNPRETAS